MGFWETMPDAGKKEVVQKDDFWNTVPDAKAEGTKKETSDNIVPEEKTPKWKTMGQDIYEGGKKAVLNTLSLLEPGKISDKSKIKAQEYGNPYTEKTIKRADESQKRIESNVEAIKEGKKNVQSPTLYAVGEQLTSLAPFAMLPGSNTIQLLRTGLSSAVGSGIAQTLAPDNNIVDTIGQIAGGLGLNIIDFTKKIPSVTKQLGEKFKIPTTAGEKLNSPLLKKIETLQEKVPFSGMRTFREHQQEGTHQAAKNLIGEYIINPNSPDIMRSNREFSSNMYESMKGLVKEIPNQRIDPTETKKISKRLLDRFPDIFKKLQDTKTEGIIRNIMQDTADKQPKLTLAERMQEMPGAIPKMQGRTVVSEPNRYNKPIDKEALWYEKGNETDLDQWRRLFKGMTPEMPKEVPKTIKEPIPTSITFDEAWTLREGLGELIGQAKKLSYSGKVNNTAYGEMKSLFKAINNDMDNWTESIGRKDISEALKSANEAYKQYVVRYDVLSRAYDKSIREIGDQVFFSPAKFSNKLDAIVKKDKYFNTFTPKQKEELSGLANIMQVAKRAGQFHENVPTGNRMLDAWLIKEAVHTAEIPLSWVSTFLTTTKPGQSILMKAAKVKANSPEMADLMKQTYIQMVRHNQGQE